MKRLKRIGMPLLTLLLVLAVWEGCVHVFDIDLYILPAPSNILQALFANRDILWLHSMVTLQEAVIGLLIATLLAIVIAIGMDLSLLFKHSIFPHLVVTHRTGHGAGTAVFHLAGIRHGTEDSNGHLHVLLSGRNRLL